MPSVNPMGVRPGIVLTEAPGLMANAVIGLSPGRYTGWVWRICSTTS